MNFPNALRYAPITGLLAALAWTLPAIAAGDPLKEQFRAPPREYSLMPLWSWNDTLTPARLTWQIDQMVEQGVYGAFMHARVGLDESATPYFSDGFWNGVRASVEHAKKVGFQAWIYDEDKWPSGAAGGRTIAANPARNTGAGLDHESLLVQGPVRKTITFPGAQFLIAARSLGADRIDPASLTNLTALNQPGGGSWDVPPGEWRLSVFRLNYGDGALPNYLNPDTVRAFLDNTYEEYARRFGEHFGDTIPGSFFDEIGNTAVAWDRVLAERFRQAKGYDLETALPLLYFDGGPRTIKVRCDYFEVFAQLFEEAWFKQISAWCDRHHLQLTGHTLESFRNIRDEGDYFRTWRHAQIPGTDNEDFRYTFPRVIGSWKPKQLSSISHVYGKERAAAESLGGPGWAITLDQTRYGVNMLSVYGINFFIFHLFHYSIDRPATMDDWPNSWFYQNPYWKYFRKLADYTRRVSFMSRQGEHVADVAILYSVEDVWSRGFEAGRPVETPGLTALVRPEIPGLATPVVPGLATPNTRNRPAAEQLVDRLLEQQIDCDLVDTDSLLQAVPVPGGRAKIGKESYRVLLLPAVRTVSLAAYRRTLELSRGGLEVLAVGVTPRHSAENGAEDPEVIRISQELFRDRSVADVAELLSRLHNELVPDVLVLSGEREFLRCLHRRVGERDVYWLVNSEKRAGVWTVQFAATGAVERWDPADGGATVFPVLKQTSRHTTLRLELKPWEGTYMVVDRAAGVAAKASTDRQARDSALPPLAVNGPWTFQLAPTELDYAWKPDPGETIVELPVMGLRVERGQPPGQDNGPDWRRIKIVDTLNPLRGAARYLSAWDAAWITRYIHQDFQGELGGPELHFQKTFDLPFEPSGAWLTLAADETFECSINGAPVAVGTSRAAPVTLESPPLRRGKNTIDIAVKGGGYLLAQGEVSGKAGESVAIRTDRTWQVRTPATDGLAAYEFTFPPFGKWGDLPLRGKPQTLPAVIWYRAVVPPGARRMEPLKVQGGYDVWINDRPLAIPASGPIPLPDGLPLHSTISLRVRIVRAEDGLQAPLVFRCGPAPAQLGDWQSLGLDWYSGRGVYRTSLDLPPAYAGRKLTVDLGELCYTGEVWLNGKLVNSLAWPPYEVDITCFAAAGKNELVVVAANLLANRMRWDIFDSAIPGQFSRWWHDGSILREAEHLRSGLLGPVRITAEAARASADGRAQSAAPRIGGTTEVAVLAAAFKEPPLSAKPRAYWDWINGAVSLEQLTRDLEEMKDKGMGGGQMWDTGAHRNPNGFVPPGQPFLGPESVAAIHHSLKEAKRLGLELGLLTSSGWNAGGPWATPEFAGKNAYFTSVMVEGPGKIEQTLPLPPLPPHCPAGPDGRPLYLSEIAVIAVPDSKSREVPGSNSVVVLSEKVKDGVLSWDAPEGRWQVMRFVCMNNGQQLIVASPNSKGSLIDFLDPAATKMHFQHILDKIGITPENAEHLGLAYLAVESMELAEGIQWTDAFRADFERWAGYDPTPYLPILAGWTIGGKDLSHRFLYDYRKAISEQLIFSHYVTANELLDKYGIHLSGEAGGPGPPIWDSCPVDALKALGNVDIPQGEFWIRHRNMFLIKEIASASHIYGRKLVDAESFTTWRRWKDGPGVLKYSLDRAFCEGLNRISYHGFTHTPPEAGFPGRSYHAGVDINPKVTWWPMARPFMDYMARCCYMLQQGQFVADVCYYYGDQAPNFWPAFHDVPEKPLLEGLGQGYDYDVVNSDVILNRMSVKDGRIVLPDGMNYRILVLRNQGHMPLEVLKKIAELVKAGATVVGPKPETVPGLKDFQARAQNLQTLAAEVWGPCDGTTETMNRYGAGRVFWGITAREILEMDRIGPDFSREDSGLDYIHRAAGDVDVFFVRNPSKDWMEATCTFRVARGKRPTFWDPADGETQSALFFTPVDQGIRMPLRLPAGGSLFVVFAPGTADAPALTVTKDASLPLPDVKSGTSGASLEVWQNGVYKVCKAGGTPLALRAGDVPEPAVLEGPWVIRFPANWGAPAQAEFATLHSWTDDPEEGIKYFSGIATYDKRVQINSSLLAGNRRLYLDLGEVRDVARVRLNGKDLGILWKAPFRVEITAAAVPGDNQLEMDVANMWINRLTGDLKLPPEQRFTRTNETPREKDIGGDEPWHVEPAGLLGPVRLVSSGTLALPLSGFKH